LFLAAGENASAPFRDASNIAPRTRVVKGLIVGGVVVVRREKISVEEIRNNNGRQREREEKPRR
jgi:hypothetical protein